MTLVQVVADENAIHMACDFRLTDYGTGVKSDRDAHKLLTVQRLGICALVGITGLGDLDGQPIGRWMADLVQELPAGSQIKDLLEVFRQRGERALSQIRDPKWRRHTFVIGSITGTQAMISLVSNFEAFERGRVTSGETASTGMRITSIKPKGAVVVLAGAGAAVTSEDRSRLELLVKSRAPAARVQEALSEINRSASGRTTTVSEGCYAASLHATGHGSAQPFLTTEHQEGFMPPEQEAWLRQLGLRINPAIGEDGKPKPIRMTGSTFVQFGAKTAKDYREQLKLRPDSAELWNNYGSFLLSRVKIDEAIVAYEKALELDPSYVSALANLAKQRWLSKPDLPEAKHLYEKAVQASEPSVPAWLLSDAAVFYAEGLGDVETARQMHERAAADPDNFLAKAHLGAFLLAQDSGSTVGAALLEDVLEGQPTNAEVLRLCARADWLYLDKSARAMERMHKACSLDPRSGHILAFAGYVCLVMGDIDSAVYYLQRAMKRIDRHWQLESNYGLALLVQGKYEAAMRHLAKARKLGPKEPAALTNLGAGLAIRSRSDGTVVMQEALAMNPEPAIELELLALLHTLGRLDDPSTSRLHELVEAGVKADGKGLRCMVANLDRATRDVGLSLADKIEGVANSSAG
jgi:Tfp pilus assembly protein PilF